MRFFLSDDDRSLLRRGVNFLRSYVVNKQTRSLPPGVRFPPETYVAKVQAGTGTIAAISGDTPGSELCDIYKVDSSGDLEDAAHDQTVYNIATAATSNTYLPAIRDKFGHWYAQDCSGVCELINEDFEGAGTSSDISGTAFTETSGDWGLESELPDEPNTRLTTDDTNAIALCTTDAPDSKVIIEVVVSIATAGDTARIILGYDDSDNYHFVELTRTTDQTSVDVYSRSGGSNTLLSAKQADSTGNPIKVCYDGTNIYVVLYNGVLSGGGNNVQRTFGVAATVSTSGTVGLATGGNNSGSSIYFDDFVLSREAASLSKCDDCTAGGEAGTGGCAACRYGVGPRQWKVVFDNVFVGDDCTNAECDVLNGTYFLDVSAGECSRIDFVINSGVYPTCDDCADNSSTTYSWALSVAPFVDTALPDGGGNANYIYVRFQLDGSGGLEYRWLRQTPDAALHEGRIDCFPEYQATDATEYNNSKGDCGFVVLHENPPMCAVNSFPNDRAEITAIE